MSEFTFYASRFTHRTSINWHPRIHLARPGIDAALEVLHLAETGTRQLLQGARRTRPPFAEDYHLIGAIQLGQALSQLAQRDERGALEAGDLQLVRFAHIKQANRLALSQAFGELADINIPSAAHASLLVVMARHSAERFIVDQRSDFR